MVRIRTENRDLVPEGALHQWHMQGDVMSWHTPLKDKKQDKNYNF